MSAPATTEIQARLNGEIHGWFELTYANFLTIPRALLQSMPEEWQERFVTLLHELEHHYGRETLDELMPSAYTVTAVDDTGRFIRNPCPHYNRGRTFIPGRLERDGNAITDGQ